MPACSPDLRFCPSSRTSGSDTASFFPPITCRELRHPENRILPALRALRGGQTELSVSLRQMVSTARFHGPDSEVRPVQIAMPACT